MGNIRSKTHGLTPCNLLLLKKTVLRQVGAEDGGQIKICDVFSTTRVTFVCGVTFMLRNPLLRLAKQGSFFI